MNIRFFNKNYEDMKFREKLLAFLLIPAVIIAIVGTTLVRLLKKCENS